MSYNLHKADFETLVENNSQNQFSAQLVVYDGTSLPFLACLDFGGAAVSASPAAQDRL
jgi:hypothetical protein